MGHETELYRVISALIQEQRRFAAAPNLAVRFQTLWIAAMLNNRLKQCTNHEVGELLIHVQDRFQIFDAEFAICEHARRRLH